MSWEGVKIAVLLFVAAIAPSSDIPEHWPRQRRLRPE